MESSDNETVSSLHFKRTGIHSFKLKINLLKYDSFILIFYLKDRFDKIISCFKDQKKEIKINVNYENRLLCSLAFICYQIIEFDKVSLEIRGFDFKT